MPTIGCLLLLLVSLATADTKHATKPVTRGVNEAAPKGQDLAIQMADIRKALKEDQPALWNRITAAHKGGKWLSTKDYRLVMRQLAGLPEADRNFVAFTWTAFGEARGLGKDKKDPADKQGRGQMLAVMKVIQNRADDKGGSPFGTATQPWQFSCWNRKDTNFLKMLVGETGNPKEKNAYAQILEAYRDWQKKPEFGGGLQEKNTTHYFAIGMKPLPNWEDPKKKLDKPHVVVPPPPPPPVKVVLDSGHQFYKGVAWSYRSYWKPVSTSGGGSK